MVHVDDNLSSDDYGINFMVDFNANNSDIYEIDHLMDDDYYVDLNDDFILSISFYISLVFVEAKIIIIIREN